MNLLESQWFFQMVEHAAKSPADRLTAIFNITETWISAPGIREQFERATHPTGHGELRLYLANLANVAGLEKPDVLATHLVILLQGAIMEELRNPGSHALSEAAKAAQAVVAHATPPSRMGRILRYSGYSLASISAVALVASMVWHVMGNRTATEPSYLMTAMHQPQPALEGFAPGDLEAVLALQEKIERGTCPAPEFLAMPSAQVTAYMNAIHFRASEDPAADRENLRAFLAWFNNIYARQCYYPPANGHTSVAWVPRQTGAR